ncbi:MAG: D-tyrosyl-tRNA(Tyr) deacylase [Bryobacterales bacterium]|nr:D-tyrosyl-tRNA(Tyr) deacylase [Bryobacterales bacterium]
MKAVIQRVSRAKVTVDGQISGQIGTGLLVLLGVSKQDQESDALYLLDKIVHLRIFPDADGRMNRSLTDVGGALLVVSQFTLYGDCRKGRRPGFDLAAPAEQARSLYEYFVSAARQRGLSVETGVFQAHMDVELTNDGPVTFLLESPQKS